MLMHPEFSPIALSLGPLSIHWYGLMYVAAFFTGLYLGKYRARQPGSGWTEEQVDDFLIYLVLGVILGGRLGYVLFYGWDYWMQDLLYIFKIWQGGMSFHGGLIGVIGALWWFGRKNKKAFLATADFVAPLFPMGLMFGRIGNFINQELWGRVTEVPWGMVFPAVDDLPRHPSPLYQAFGEGFLLFLLVWWFSSKKRPAGSVAGIFLIGYAFFRSTAEIFRVPDAQIGFLASDFLTMGMLLSIPMAILGIILLAVAYKK